jgi:hypothetical protein
MPAPSAPPHSFSGSKSQSPISNNIHNIFKRVKKLGSSKSMEEGVWVVRNEHEERLLKLKNEMTKSQLSKKDKKIYDLEKRVILSEYYIDVINDILFKNIQTGVIHGLWGDYSNLKNIDNIPNNRNLDPKRIQSLKKYLKNKKNKNI